MHARFKPKRHQFRYRIASLLLDLDEMDEIRQRCRLFSVNRFNLFSFHERDHGPRDGSPVKPWVEDGFAQAGHPIEGGRVLALCFPRTLGYAFNPLTIYWGYRADGGLAGVLYEVKNTFGDQHGYIIPAPDGHVAGTPLIQAADKCFHVSPFLPIEGEYRFRIGEPVADPEERLRVLIKLIAPDGSDRMIATHVAERRPITDRGLLATLVSHPLNTAKVIAAIHMEAVRLLMKGARFHKRPEPPALPISTGRDVGSTVTILNPNKGPV
jgi:hypothetical protein